MPKLIPGLPPADASQSRVWEAGGVKVYYPELLRNTPGESRIRVRLRRFLLFKWLEMDGARAILCNQEEEPRR